MPRRALTLLMCALAICLAGGLGSAQDLQISLILPGSGTYVIGKDTIDVSVIAFNSGSDVNVDVHVAVLPPIGGILEVPDWNTEFRPLFSNLRLPQWFTYSGPLASYNAGDYPFDEEGSYYFAAAFTEPGTLNFVSEIDLFPFTVMQQGEPDETGGQLSLSRTETFSSGYGWQTTVTAGGWFDEWYEMKRPAILGDEGCEVTFHEIGSETGNSIFLDAGDKIDMTGSPNGNIELSKYEWAGMITYGTSGELNLGDCAAGNQYTFTGYGGADVGAFSGSVAAPEVIDLYSPSIETNPNIPVNQDLNVTWNGTGHGQVYVGISSYNDVLNPTLYSCLSCVFADDGEGSISHEYLEYLCEHGATISIWRVNMVTFSASGIDESGGYIYIVTEQMGEVTLQ